MEKFTIVTRFDELSKQIGDKIRQVLQSNQYEYNEENPDTVCYRNDFTNIILVFDYERHDPTFSEEKIIEMQHFFEDSTDMGKLYLNYPMIESYLHLKSIPDEEYIHRKIPVSIQQGNKYKSMVK